MATVVLGLCVDGNGEPVVLGLHGVVDAAHLIERTLKKG
jgi:hypothetical protein